MKRSTSQSNAPRPILDDDATRRLDLSDRTQRLALTPPANPRFTVTPGGLKRDWRLLSHVCGGMGLVLLVFAVLLRWPAARPVAPTVSLTPIQRTDRPEAVPAAMPVALSQLLSPATSALQYEPSALRSSGSFAPVSRTYPLPTLYPQSAAQRTPAALAYVPPAVPLPPDDASVSIYH